MWLKRCKRTGRPHAGTPGCSTARRPHSLRVMPYRPRGSVVQPSQVPKHGAPTFDHPWRARRLLSFDVWSSPRYLGRWNARRQGLRSGALSKHQECNQRDNGPQERREQERRGKVQFRHEPAVRPCLTVDGIDRQVRIIQRSRVRLKQRRTDGRSGKAKSTRSSTAKAPGAASKRRPPGEISLISTGMSWPCGDLLEADNVSERLGAFRRLLSAGTKLAKVPLSGGETWRNAESRIPVEWTSVVKKSSPLH